MVTLTFQNNHDVFCSDVHWATVNAPLLSSVFLTFYCFNFVYIFLTFYCFNFVYIGNMELNLSLKRVDPATATGYVYLDGTTAHVLVKMFSWGFQCNQ